MSKRPRTRQHESSIEIPIPVEQVWKAITEADEIRKWFAPEVRVEPRTGGEYFVSWGPGQEGPGVVEIFERERHLRVVTERQAPGQAQDAASRGAQPPIHLGTDYFLETARGRTFLRVVQSGFPNSADWDGEFGATKAGWPIFLRILRHGLTRHPGAPGTQEWVYAKAPTSCVDAWAKLMGPEGLCAKSGVQQLAAGARYAFVASDGQKLEGLLQAWSPPREFCGTWEAANDGLLTIACMESRGITGLMVQLSLYGLGAVQVKEIRRRWESLMSKLFPPPGVAVA